jgi:hypothetical protein
MLGSDSDLDSSNSDIYSFKITSVSNQITTSESENDEVFYTADDAGFLFTDDFEYVEINRASKYGNLETLNTYISDNSKEISNCKLENVEAILPTLNSENPAAPTISKSDQNDKLDKKIYLEEFRKDMISMFFLVQKNREFSTTKANLNSLKDIENDLNKEIINVCESNLNLLKHYFDLLSIFLIFFDDEENDNSPEFLQEAISKVQLKLENIDEIINMIDQLQGEEELEPLDLGKFREEITRLKELLDEETKYYRDYIDFRRENCQNHSFLIKDKLFKLQENLKIKMNEIFLKNQDELKNKETLVDDNFVKEIEEFIKGLYLIIDAYSPFLMNYKDALNDIWIFNVEL